MVTTGFNEDPFTRGILPEPVIADTIGTMGLVRLVQDASPEVVERVRGELGRADDPAEYLAVDSFLGGMVAGVMEQIPDNTRVAREVTNQGVLGAHAAGVRVGARLLLRRAECERLSGTNICVDEIATRARNFLNDNADPRLFKDDDTALTAQRATKLVRPRSNIARQMADGVMTALAEAADSLDPAWAAYYAVSYLGVHDFPEGQEAADLLVTTHPNEERGGAVLVTGPERDDDHPFVDVLVNAQPKLTDETMPATALDAYERGLNGALAAATLIVRAVAAAEE